MTRYKAPANPRGGVLWWYVDEAGEVGNVVDGYFSTVPHRILAMPRPSVSTDNKLRYCGKGPFYEVYYFKLVDDHRSLWIRFTLNRPKDKEGEAALWAVLDGPEERFAIKKNYPLGSLDLVHRERFIQIQRSYLSLSETRGEISEGGHEILWNLDFEDPTVSLHLYPSWLYRLPFPKTKFLEPRLKGFVSGEIFVDGKRWVLKHQMIHQAHLWGSAYASRWVWGNCVRFDGGSDTIFEGLGAQISLGSLESPPMALFSFHWKGRHYPATGPINWFKTESTHDLEFWNFDVIARDKRFVGALRRRPDQIIGVAYTGPNGEERFCHSTMMAEMELKIYDRKGPLLETLLSHEAAFETVELIPDPRVKFLL